ENNQAAVFEFDYAGNHFKGTYKGLAAIAIDEKGNLVKLAATSFGSFSKNGKPIFSLSKEADLFVTNTNGKFDCIVADSTKMIKVILN
ncbi:MAG: hypothetical protein B7Y76_06205, partial [Sphingobacteriia bacterium 35-40-5]